MILLASASAVYTVWWVSLALAVVVTIVVGILLSLILRQARQIEAGAKQIWTTGKLIANNTYLVALLGRTNQVVADILESAGGIAMATRRIEEHAKTCPG